MAISRTINDIIVKALQQLNIYAMEENIPSAAILDGVYLVNSLLDNFMAEGLMIPYFTDINFTMTPLQGEYIVNPDGSGDITANKIQSLAYVTVINNETSYPVEIIDYNKLLNVQYTTTTTGRPFQVILQNFVGYSKLIFYYIPDTAYECNIRCKVQIEDIDKQDDINELPVEYHRFLRYALMREYKDFYQSNNWSQTMEADYQKMMSNLKANTDFDLSAHPTMLITTAAGRTNSDIRVRS